GHVRLCFFVRRSLLRDSGALAYIKATPLFLMPNWWIRDNEETLEQAALDTLDSFPSVKIADARIDAVLAFDRTEQLDAIHTPTLVLCAQDDILTPPYYSEELARRIPGAELVMLERGGHACSQTTPAQFNEAVLPFLLRKE
ncbi:MAG: alpha/beta hydrolase, partial [Rhodospirillales bacterium]|nr:alpha/beta hydrolase [Rhodospirillales bacterium]